MDIFQRLWENTRREYLVIVNEWVRIDAEYTEAIAPWDDIPIYEFDRMYRNFLTTETIGHAFDIAYNDVQHILNVMNQRRCDLDAWRITAAAFEGKHKRTVFSRETDSFYRVQREATFRGLGFYILLDTPPSDEIYDLIPDFDRGLR